MNSDPIKTLFLPFETGECALPAPKRGLFLRAEAHLALDAAWKEALICVQGFKPSHDALARTGFMVESLAPPNHSFDLILLRLTKHKQENLGAIAQALEALVEGGVLHVAGAKDEGIESIEKLIKTLFEGVETRSKHHARTFWFTKPKILPADIISWALALQPKQHLDSYVTAPGMFSFDKIDRGSQLLAAYLPLVIKGRVADFGAGWGYLSREVLAHCPSIVRLDLYEAEANALECAKLNLSSSEKPIYFNWADITRGDVPDRTYDFIVMNPPFHTGKSTQASLGQAFIQAASKAMKPGGRLFMVANRQLPYELVLKATFSNVKLLVEADGFKIYDAKR